jgi:L-lactate dehydrogenase
VAIACAAAGTVDHITFQDLDADRAEAEALDLSHGTLFLPSIAIDGGSEAELLAGCDVVVITAGAKQKSGQSRLDLAEVNAGICRSTVATIKEVAPTAVIVVVSNPVDVMTHVALECTDTNPVIGSGTLLDSARLRVLLAEKLQLSPAAVHATIIGEHGDTGFAPWSVASVGGIPLRNWLDGRSDALLDSILTEVRGAAQRIIAGKGATSTAIGFATNAIVNAIVSDERRVLPVSSLHDVDGVGEVCLSMPAVIGSHGVIDKEPLLLTDEEQAKLVHSAQTIHRATEAVRG